MFDGYCSSERLMLVDPSVY